MLDTSENKGLKSNGKSSGRHNIGVVLYKKHQFLSSVGVNNPVVILVYTCIVIIIDVYRPSVKFFLKKNEVVNIKINNLIFLHILPKVSV